MESKIQCPKCEDSKVVWDQVLFVAKDCTCVIKDLEYKEEIRAQHEKEMSRYRDEERRDHEKYLRDMGR